MRKSSKAILATGLLALAAQTSAQVASICPATDVCYKLNIPESTASSGNGDIFFQISAPSSYDWVALGQGRGMSGANMFLVYTAAGGSNVTLSPRTTTGHNPPQFNRNTQLTLLEGSGVSNGKMVANVKCSNCNSWSGGTMDFKLSSGSWVYAYHSTRGPKNSNDQSAEIEQHTDASVFRWDFTNAKGGNSVNPLVNAAPSTGDNTGTNTGSGFTAVASNDNSRKKLIAHGVLASLAFVLFFPMGAISIRLANFPGIVWIHAAFQCFAYIVYIAGFGLGVSIACSKSLLDRSHPIIGIVVFVLIFFQPILGFMHHAMFKKHSRRTFWSYGHVWLGRIVITLGIINGGLGMQLAHKSKLSSTAGMIVYGVIAGLMWLAWVGAAIIGERRRSAAGNGATKYTTRAGSDGSETAPTEPKASQMVGVE